LRRVPTVKELRELMDEEAAATHEKDFQARGVEAHRLIQWEAEELASMAVEVNKARDPMEWAMVFRLAGFKLEEKARKLRTNQYKGANKKP